MVFEINENELLCSFILDYTDQRLTPAEEKSFTELICNNSIVKKHAECNRSVNRLLSGLPQIKAKPTFDRKMAAAFAMELERETTEANRKYLSRHLAVR
jgi:hypothetical protein